MAQALHTFLIAPSYVVRYSVTAPPNQQTGQPNATSATAKAVGRKISAPKSSLYYSLWIMAWYQQGSTFGQRCIRGILHMSGTVPAALFLVVTHALLLRVMRSLLPCARRSSSLLAWLAVGLRLGASFCSRWHSLLCGELEL